jgi:hypothetical protein
MLDAARLAGFIAAHGVWCVSDGGPLIPMAGYVDADGQRNLIRFAGEELSQCVERGKAWLEANPEDAARATFVYDAFLTLDSGRTDALIIEARDFGSGQELVMAIPYRGSDTPEGFAVFRPKFIELPGDVQILGAAFFEGVDAHEQGAQVWNAHLDQSR